MSGIQTEPTSDTGGGQNVGWFDVGDWLSYSAVNLGCSGTYTVEYRVAANGAGGSFTLEQAGGGASYGSLNVPNTGGWQNWTNISHDLVLPGGSQSFGIAISQGGWNLNWFKVTEKDCNGNPTPTPTSTPNPGDDITANQAAQAMGKGFNLGQMFESDDKPRTLAAAKAKIDAYYALGFRNVRIPVSWTINIGGSTLANSDGAVDRNHSRVQTIQQVVDYALSLPNLYVIINTHHEGPIKDGNQWWRLERIWADLADIFRDRDHRLLFELLNEPHLGDGSAMPAGNLRNMSGKAYNKIREVDSKRIILIGGNQWFHANEMAEVWPNLNEVGHGQDQYVMATFHHYAPWFEFHSEDAWPKDLNFNDGTVSDPMETMKQWANTVGNGMPVHIGEWGVGWGKLRGSMTCNNIRLWYQKFGPFSAERNQPTSVWDDGGWFKIFDHGTNSFNNNLAQCVSGNCDWNTAERMNSGCF
ncbi:MAG: glycosyl hydrolase family 5 [Alteromonadaceae bacterium]|nr:MAG: glycosyl hydrolase family 5 [Alteromonadaceae bacterium]